MDSAFSFRIFKEFKLICVCSLGESKYEQIRTLPSMLKADPDFNPEFTILYDIRGSKLKVSPEVIEEFMTQTKTEQDFIAARTEIYITDTPDQIIIPNLLKRKEDFPIEIEIVSTFDAATELLALNESQIAFLKEVFGKI